MRRRRQQSPWLVIGIMAGVGAVVLVLACCGGVGYFVWKRNSPADFPPETQSYAEARKTFHTKLVRNGPAPQAWDKVNPPADAREIRYESDDLQLKAWVSKAPDGNGKLPAILFLHGGFAFDTDDWDMTEPFRDAGFVVMTPMLRGENGLPGDYSMFYDEVDDVLAAADALARLPYVDPQRIYVAGHSVGGTLALLASMTSNRFRAAASFSGSPDQVAWAKDQQEFVPFDPNDQREFQMRSPLAFPKSFQCPVRLYYGSDEPFFRQSTDKLARLSKQAGRDVEAVRVPGDHMGAVEPAMQQCIAFFRQH